MPISIEWGTRIISIPKSYLTLIQSTPIEILALDLNFFRLDLKDLEDSEYGIPMLDTHTHNPPLDVGGVTLARTVEIINGYTVTFEDGQYAVNLTGANSNVGDVVNVNQVSVRSSNSAGLVTNAAIEYGEFGGNVTVDVVNGVSGTIYPKGTQRMPVNNVPDAVLIASTRGFTKIHIIGDITLDTGDDLRDYVIEGQTQIHTTITVLTGALVEGCIFRNCTLTGVLDGDNIVEDCRIDNINYLNGYIRRCLLRPCTISLGGNNNAHFLDCWNELGGDIPVVDMGGSGQDLNFSGYKGAIQINNLTDAANKAIINIESGEVIVDSSITGGNVVLRGVGTYTHNQTGNEDVDVRGLVNATTIANSVWDNPLSEHDIIGTAGRVMLSYDYNTLVYLDAVDGVDGTEYPSGTSKNPVKTLSSAKALLTKYSLNAISIIGSLTLSGGEDLSDLHIISHTARSHTINILNGITVGTHFVSITVEGTLNGSVLAYDCILKDITDFSGLASDCTIDGYVTFAINTNNTFINPTTSGTTGPDDYVRFDIGDNPLTILNGKGQFELYNKTDAQYANTHILNGKLKINNTCNDGTVLITGLDYSAIVDESAAGCTVEIINDNNTFAKKSDIYPLY